MKYNEAKENMVSRIHQKLVGAGQLYVSKETPLDDICHQEALIREAIDKCELESNLESEFL